MSDHTLTFYTAVYERIPQADEIDGIMEQINLFYAEELRKTYSNLDDLVATTYAVTSEAKDWFTVTDLSFVVDLLFDDSKRVPTRDEVDVAIQTADMSTFMEHYIPKATPEGTIFQRTYVISSLTNDPPV